MKTESEFIDQILKPISKNPEENGLNIYRWNYLLNHVAALKDHYPTIEKILGEGNFRYFAKLYLESHPPIKSNIDFFGDQFSNFLTTRAELKAMPQLVEFAKLDWLWHQRFSKPVAIVVWRGVLQIWNQHSENLEIEDRELDPNFKAIVSIHGIDDKFFLEESDVDC